VRKNKIDIKYGSLFPWPFQLIAVLVFIAAVSLVTEKPALSILFMIAGVFIISGYEGTEIDIAAKTYKEYKSFFLIKTGNSVSYSGIEKIFINTSKTRQQLYTAHTTKSSIYENIEFNGFLKFDDGEKIQLLTRRNKKELIKALEKISALLQVSLEDNTGVEE